MFITQSAEWQDYQDLHEGEDHTVTGELKVLEDLRSTQLGNKRDILVYLPPSYSSGNGRYPVIYMQDGQNLFDEETSFAGEWYVDETLDRLSQEGIEAIVVGIPNAGPARIDEYSPYHSPAGGGMGDPYLDFVVKRIKPLIDDTFRTRPDREHTGIIGSSMGGLISLYAFFRHPTVFGFCGAMSPALWFARWAIFGTIQVAPSAPGRIYIDAGTREEGTGPSGSRRSRRYYASVRRLHRVLARKGYRPRRELLYIEEKWAGHNEAAWARRLPDALRFLLSG